MSMFEEETWDAAPDVNKLDDGLFGKAENDYKKTDGEEKTPVKRKRGQRSQGGPTDRSKKWKTKTKEETKSEKGVRPPGDHKRGKRGNKKWVKKEEDEEATGKDSQTEREKKLKLKIKMKQGKAKPPAGKAPRNKYKQLAIMREQQQNSNNSRELQETLNKPRPVKEQKQYSHEAAELETQAGKIKKEKKSKTIAQKTDTPELPEQEKKKAKKEKMKVVATQEVVDDEAESMNDTAAPKKKAKKRKESHSVLACSTPVESKEKRKKATETISEGLFRKVNNSDDDASSSEDTQPELSKRKKKKEKLIQPPLEDTDEPAKKKKKNQWKIESISEDTDEPAKKKKKKNQLKTESLPEDTKEPAKKKKMKQLKTENTDDIGNDSFADNVDSTKTKKKKKGKSEDSEEENVKSNHPSPQMKSPFHIGKLKHALDRKPIEGEAVSGKKQKSEALEESSKAKSKKSEPLSLRERMQAQLSGARFRFINEQLYTCTGEEALQLMQTDKDAFKVYHDGFTSQVEKWPENPVNRVIKFVKSRPQAVVADMGCGDAKLAQSVSNKVHSFDLVAVNEHITVCDIAQLPLPDDSVDIAVFCLALMGTNFVDFICEANRALKTGGTLIIAEVVSRFEKVGAFVRKMTKLGFEISKKDDSNKMFIWLEFTKTSEAPSAERRPQIELTPCIYKKR